MSAIRRTRIAAVAGAALAAALAASAPANAAPAVSGEFALSGSPQYLALGPDGNVWTTVTGSGVGNDVAKITPAGDVTEYNVATLDGAKGITAGPDGNLWVTKPNGVAKFAPTSPAGATATAIADIPDPRAITVGPDSNLWTASNDKVVRFSAANPAGFTSKTVTGMGARGITAGGDGALYIADFGSQRIVRYTTADAATFVNVGGGPQEVAAGPGTQVGFANPGASPQVFGRIDGGAVSGTSPMANTDPFGIALGNDGAYWVARFAANDIARVTTDGQVTPLAGLSAASGPRYITKGAGDTLWVGLETAKKVARITGVEAPATPTAPATPATPSTPTTPAALAPAVLKLKVTSNAFRRGSRLPALTTAKTGSQLRFTLTQPATVRFTFAKATVGRKVGSSCVKRTRQNAKRKRCVYSTPVRGSFSVKANAAGDQRVRFQGRISARRTLAPGRYRVTARAAAAGTTSAPANATFTIKAS